MNLKKNKNYFFSIIIPIYNSELWLNQTLNSIISQDIGFENIQLILVDDGSTDNSFKICNSFKSLYPDNIILICQNNNGVAAARNNAIPYIKGKYIQFLDSDDYISNNTLKNVYNFFKENMKIIDIVSIPMQYFEGRTGSHYLNVKFKNGNRIINLEENFTDILVHVNSIFIKSELINNFRFDESLVTCEDGKIAIQLLMENKKYGVINNCQYNYRLRKDKKNSLSQIAKKNKDWYIPQMINYPLWAYKYCYDKEKNIPDFVKFIIASHIQWRIKSKIRYGNSGLLTQEENKKYNELLNFSIGFIDDYIIDELTQISDYEKEYMKSLKSNKKDVELTDTI